MGKIQCNFLGVGGGGGRGGVLTLSRIMFEAVPSHHVCILGTELPFHIFVDNSLSIYSDELGWKFEVNGNAKNRGFLV